MFKKLISILLCPMMALPLFAGSVGVSADTAKADTKGIVGEWMWASTIADAGADGAEKIMARCAEMGITDVYLLVKGTGGKLGYLKTKYTENLSRTNRDVLQEAIDAGHARGIRIHAWICNMEDALYKSTHNEAGMWHYIRARDNDRINLYDPGYREYMTTIAAELAAYDIDGLHFDYIRYNHLANGWGENDLEALKSMGANLDRVKELIETTFGYHGRTANSNYVFNAYSNGDPDAKIIAEYRRNNVKDYATAVIAAAKAVKPNLIISAATMPEGAYNSSYADLHYGQNYDDAALLYDYICPMAYSSSYGQSPSWVLSIVENSIKRGNKVVIGLQAYEKATTDRLMSEMDTMELFKEDKTYGDGLLGAVFFRTGTIEYAKVTHDTEKKVITIKVFNTSTSKGLSSVQVNALNGIKLKGASVGDGISSSAKIKFAKNGSYITFQGTNILPYGKEGFLYLQYEGDIDPAKAPVLVTVAGTSDICTYNTYRLATASDADKGAPDTFETAPAVTTAVKVTTTAEVTTTPEITEKDTSPADTTTAENNTKGKGCGAVVSGIAVIGAAVCAAIILKKKKKD